MQLTRETALNYLMGFTVEMRPRKDFVWTEWRDPETGNLFSHPSTADRMWRSCHSEKDYDHQVVAICGIPVNLLGLDPC